MIFNDDKPGAIGSIGTVLGKHGVNINTLGVGNKAEEGKAIFLVNLDKQPCEEAVKELGELELVNEVYACNLE